MAENASFLHARSDLHLARKVWHMSTGIAIVGIYMLGVPRSMAVVILGSMLAFSLCIEIVRLKVPSLNKTVIQFWGPLMRESEANRFSGTPYYIAAAIIAIGIFPKPIAVLSIAFLAVGDPLASFFGVLYGDRSVRFSNGKSLIGTLAGGVSSALTGAVFLILMNQSGWLHLSHQEILIVSILGGLAGGGAELLPMEVDDNFAIPVVSGFMLWLCFMVMGLD